MLSAPSAPLSPNQGSIATRARRFVGGIRSRDESAGDFRARMDAGRASNAAAPQAVNPGTGLAMPTRRDNIVAARADGTFDAKRDAYNKSGAATGHSMDEAGNIITPPQTAGTPARPAATSPASPTPGLPATIKRPAPARPTGGKINGMPAAQAIAGVKAAQAQIPRQTAQNPRSSGFQMPSVAAAMKPSPVTSPTPSLVTSQVTPAVTPPSPNYRPPAPAAPAAPRPAAAPLSNAQIMTPDVAKLALQHNPHVPGYAAARARMSDDAFNARWRTEHAPTLSQAPGPGVPVSNAGLGLPRPIAARADGGPVEAKKPYLVGEKGPEVVVPKTRSGAPAPKGWSPPAQPTPKVDFAEIARRHNINPDGSDALLPAIAQALRHPAGNPSKILKSRRSFIAGRRADGGPVDKGKPYLVGERGPEVVIPDQPGTVIPNHAINPNAYPGLSAMPPRPKATTAQPMVRQKVDGKNWKPSARPAAKAVAGNWRLPPPKIAPSLLVAR